MLKHLTILATLSIPSIAQADIVIEASGSGWCSEARTVCNNINTNVVANTFTNIEFSDWFAFQIPTLPDTIVAATLSIWNQTEQYVLGGHFSVGSIGGFAVNESNCTPLSNGWCLGPRNLNSYFDFTTPPLIGVGAGANLDDINAGFRRPSGFVTGHYATFNLGSQLDDAPAGLLLLRGHLNTTDYIGGAFGSTDGHPIAKLTLYESVPGPLVGSGLLGLILLSGAALLRALEPKP